MFKRNFYTVTVSSRSMPRDFSTRASTSLPAKTAVKNLATTSPQRAASVMFSVTAGKQNQRWKSIASTSRNGWHEELGILRGWCKKYALRSS